MTPKQFAQRYKLALEADPLLDFVKDLVAQGVTEMQLHKLLETQSLVADPLKIALQNKYRDFHLISR